MSELNYNWKRNLIIIWTTQFITMLAMNMVTPFLPFLVKNLGILQQNEVAKWGGYLFSGPFIFSLFFVPLWGFLGDKYGRKKMVIRALIGLGISQLLIGLSYNVYQVLAARIIQGMLSGFLPAAMVLVLSNTPNEKTSYALGLMQSATAAGSVVGPFLGGLLSDIIGIKFLFFIVAFTCLAMASLVLFKFKENEQQREQTKEFKVKEIIYYVIKSKSIIIILISLVFSSMALSFLQPIFPLYVENLGLNKKYIATITGLLFGTTGLFVVISAPLWGKLNLATNIKRNLTIASILSSLCYFLHFFITNPIVLTINRACLGIGLGGINPALFSLINSNSPQDRKGSIVSFGSSAQILGSLIGPTLSGLIAFGYGINYSFIFSALFVLMITVIINLNLNSKFLKQPE